MKPISRVKITQEQYNLLYQHQSQRCKICLRSGAVHLRRPLFVDHCHRTMKVRGLLCSNCNTAIGLVDDDVDRLYKLIEYLNQSV